MNPEHQFTTWFNAAHALAEEEASRCFVATSTQDGHPSVRVVYHRPGASGRVRFFTNYESRKGQELAQNPNVAVVFHWAFLEQQVRLEGRCEKVPAADSDAYFYGRPHDSQVASALSPQSRPIASTAALRAEHEQRLLALAGQPIRRPEHWGGYELVPSRIEFWQAGAARLHERTLWTLNAGTWTSQIIAP